MGQRGSHSDSLNLAVAQRRMPRSLTVTASMSRPLHVKEKMRRPAASQSWYFARRLRLPNTAFDVVVARAVSWGVCPARLASIRTLGESWSRIRCMLGSGPPGRCYLVSALSNWCEP